MFQTKLAKGPSINDVPPSYRPISSIWPPSPPPNWRRRLWMAPNSFWPQNTQTKFCFPIQKLAKKIVGKFFTIKHTKKVEKSGKTLISCLSGQNPLF